MGLEQGVNKLIEAQKGSSGQTKAGKYSAFMGILADEEFENLRKNVLPKYMGLKNLAGRAGRASSLQRTVAGSQKGKSLGMTADAKKQIVKTMADNELQITDLQDQVSGYEGQVGDLSTNLDSANTTIADQQTQIDDLNAQLIELQAPSETPTEPISVDEEGLLADPVP